MPFSLSLHEAVQLGNLPRVEDLIARDPASVNTLDNQGRQPLHYASLDGYVEIVQLLIEHRANVDAADGLGARPLHFASWRGYTEIARLLIVNGANVDAADGLGARPLHFASERGHTETARLLIEHRANVDAADGVGTRPLHLASWRGYTETARLFIVNGANIDAADGLGARPLHFASARGHTETARLLIVSGASVDVVNNLGVRPLHFASWRGHTETARLLIINGANAGTAPNDGGEEGPLHFASARGHTETARLLIVSGANVNAVNNREITPLHFASGRGHTETVRLLIVSGANVNAVTDEGLTPLHFASARSHTETVRLLIVSGANVNAATHRGLTPLHFVSARGGHIELASLLIVKGANINALGHNGETPLHLAFLEGHRKMLKLFIRTILFQDPAIEKPNYLQEKVEFSAIWDEYFRKINDAYQKLSIRYNPELAKTILSKISRETELVSLAFSSYAQIPSLSECLSSPINHGSSLNIKKRALSVSSLCEISWKDVEKFSEEEGEREIKKLKIKSEEFLRYIQDPSHSEEKRAQLLQLAEKVAITGKEKGQVHELIKGQKSLVYLNRVNYISTITTYGMIAKNILGDLLEEDDQGLAINLGFMVVGKAVSKGAKAALLTGEKLFVNDQRLLGQSLKLASVFIARGTAALIAYDLVSQIKAYRQGDPDALVGMVGDGIYLGLEGAELGIEVAEISGVLAGVSSFTGPIGAGLGVLVFMGTDVYLAVKRVKQEDALIHLTRKEKWIEGGRAFVGMQAAQYIKDLQEEKQMNNQLYSQGIDFLKNHTDFQRYIFSSAVLEQKCSIEKVKGYDASGLIGGIRPVMREVEKCTDEWQTEVTSVVMLDEKRKGIRWSRAKPDVIEGNIFCAPIAPLESEGILSDEETYFCDQAIGIEFPDFRTSNTTLIALGKGDDRVVGFPYGKHRVVLGDGDKDIVMGAGDDIFILNSDRVTGHLDGGGGINTLDLESFARQGVVRLTPSGIDTLFFFINAVSDDPIIEETELPEISALKIYNVQHFLLRSDEPDEVWVPACFKGFFDTGGGGSKKGKEDKINIIEHKKDKNHACFGDVTLLIRSHTILSHYGGNKNKNSHYTYLVPQQTGSAVMTLSSTCAFHRFVFEATLLDLIRFKWNKRDNYFEIIVGHVKLQEALSPFNLRINVRKPLACGASRQRLSFQLGDNAQIRWLEDKFHVLQRSNRSSKEIIRKYPKLATSLNFSMVVHSTFSNESIAIGNASNDVLHNDPSRRSHLVGNGGENIFVVSAGGEEDLARNKLPMPEVVLYDTDDKNLIDTLDLRQVKQQLEKALEEAIEARVNVMQGTSDLAIELFSTQNPKLNLLVVRLKDGLLTNWYRRLHVILNHAPMKLDRLRLKPLPLKVGPQAGIIIISPQDIEENTRLMIPKRIGNYRFLRWQEADLMLTNAFDRNTTSKVRYVLLLRDFYDVQKLASLSIKFVDKKLLLKDEREPIAYASDFLLEYALYRHTLYLIPFDTRLPRASVSLLPRKEVAAKSLEEKKVNDKSDATSGAFAQDKLGAFYLLKYVSHYLGGKSFVSRMNEMELRQDNSHLGASSVLDVIERKVKVALENIESRYGVKHQFEKDLFAVNKRTVRVPPSGGNLEAKRKTASRFFIQPSSIYPSMASNSSMDISSSGRGVLFKRIIP